MAVHRARYERMQKVCLSTGNQKDPVKNQELCVVSVQIRIKRLNGLGWKAQYQSKVKVTSFPRMSLPHPELYAEPI